MKFFIHREPIPYLIIEDLYEEEELERIYRELEFLHSKLLGPSATGSAKDPDGNILKENKGVFLDEVYRLREFSDILNINRKLFNEEIYNKLLECSPLFALLKNLNADSTLISYYEDASYYKSHRDNSIISMCTWFFQEPKNFTGGDFILSDYNIHIPVKNNQTVIFFSTTYHEVTETKMIDYNKICSGRFSLSTFVTTVPK
jgi:Rps23 Pro-64 3,4-dihydroxylase Tpa1-like proline 4-hydroxylase